MRSLLVRVGVKALYHTITYFGLLRRYSQFRYLFWLSWKTIS